MNLRDILAFRDFIGDVKGVISRRAWEGISADLEKGLNASNHGDEMKYAAPSPLPLPPPLVNRKSSREVELMESVLGEFLESDDVHKQA